MRRTVLMLALTLAVGIAVGMIAGEFLNAQQAPVKRTMLLKTDLAGMEGKEGRVLLIEIAPGGSTGVHPAPGHIVRYVLEGSLILEVEGRAPITVKAGDANYTPPKQMCDAKNASKTAPIKFLSFLIAEKGSPTPAR